MELRYCEGCGDVVQVETSQTISHSDHFLCDSCKGGASAAKTAAPRDPGLSTVLEGANLDLFSQDTIALRKKQYQEDQSSKQPKSSRLRLVKSGSTSDSTEPAAPAGEGCTSPAKSARKILFRCLHCRSTLSIRPVDKTSKLTCPQCGKSIYVTASGQLLKSSPSVRMEGAGPPAAGGKPRSVGLLKMAPTKPGSAAVPRPASKPGSAAVPRVGSAAVPKQKSGAVLKAPSAAVAKGSSAVKKGGSQAISKPQSVRMAEPRGSEAVPQYVTLEKRSGSSRAGKPGGQQPSTVPGASVSRVKLTDVNPAGGWAPRASSAFAEHQAKQDPGKTAFITDEETGDFSDLAPGGKPSAPRERIPLPRLAETSLAPSGELGALLPDEGELMEEGNDFASAAAKSFDRQSLFQRRAPAARDGAKGARGRPGGGLAPRLVKACLLALCLGAPMVVACGLFTREASAKTSRAPRERSSAFSLEGLGSRVTQGVHKLLFLIGKAGR